MLGVKIGRTGERCRILTETRTPIPAKITVAGGNACKKISKQKFPTTKYLSIHQPNSLANCIGKRVQNIHSWGNPFREPVVASPGLVECGDLISKDGEDCLRGFARLKTGK